jgi:hypothetical protein
MDAAVDVDVATGAGDRVIEDGITLDRGVSIVVLEALVDVPEATDDTGVRLVVGITT